MGLSQVPLPDDFPVTSSVVLSSGSTGAGAANGPYAEWVVSKQLPAGYYFMETDGGTGDTRIILSSTEYSFTGASPGKVYISSPVSSYAVNGRARWNQVNTGIATSGTGSGAAFGNNRYVYKSIVANEGTVSTNGLNWATSLAPGTSGNMISGVINNMSFVNGFFAYGNSSITTAGALSLSTDGVNWVTRLVLTSLGVPGKVAYGNALYVVHGANNLATSPDLVTWTSRPVLTGIDNRTLSYAGSWFVASGPEAGRLYVSTDGTTWATRATGGTSQVGYQTAFGNNMYVLACGTEMIISSNFTTWTIKAVLTSRTGQVVFGNGWFVANDGRGANVLVSTDGNTWTTRDSNRQASILIHGNDRFIGFVGTSDQATTITSSPTGIVGQQFLVGLTVKPTDLTT